MKANPLLLICLGMACQVAMAAAPTNAEPRWVLDANGCKFLNPAPPGVAHFTVTWTGQCVDGFVSGPGEVRAGSWFAYYGEFSQGRIVKGVAEMNGSIYEGGFLLVRGTIATEDGRTYEIDVEKGEVLEVMKDGSKRPVDQLPADITA